MIKVKGGATLTMSSDSTISCSRCVWRDIKSAPIHKRVLVATKFEVCTAIYKGTYWMIDPMGDNAIEGDLCNVVSWMPLPDFPNE